jgi:hypothetical protein
MKTASIVLRSAIALCFAFVMSSASCDLFDKVDDVTFEVSLDHTFTIDEDLEDENVAYSVTEVLDAADINPDFKKYKDRITAVTVTSVTYQISNVEQAEMFFTNGKIGFAEVTASAPASSNLASLGVEDIKAAEGTVKVLPYDQAAIDALANLLKNDKKANFYLTGTLAETPAQFKVKVTVKASITADAL